MTRLLEPEDRHGSWLAFLRHEVPIQRANYRICCVVAMIFMPAGSFLELLLPDRSHLWHFMPARWLNSLALAIIWLLLGRVKSARMVRLLGLSVALPPITAIAWMIHQLGGAESSYYAGLNLVMVGAVLLMRWTVWDSTLVVLATMTAYLLACIGGGQSLLGGIFLSNLYFICVTGVMVVVGTWLYNSIRFNEFLLRRTLDQKHEEVVQANLKLEENNQKLRELDEAKSRFFANISHELRTPLTLLIAPVETLLHKGADISQDQRQEMLATMQANAMRLLKLINTLLELVRLDTRAVELRKAPMLMSDFIQGLGRACSALAQDKRITLQVTCDPDIRPMLADVEKLERICLNLLFNALKFTPAGGTIRFSASLNGSQVLIQVKDSGVGIATEHLPHLFSRFWQADASSQRRFQGLGLGLALVKELVEVHGGSVSVESSLGKGATFSVLLPYEEAVSEAPAARPRLNADGEPTTGEWIMDLYRRAEFSGSVSHIQRHRELPANAPQPRLPGASARQNKPRLLIAEDEPDMMAYLRGQLADSFEIIEALDGNEAVTKAVQYLPDAILSDLMMPYKDGMQVCRELRERTSTRAIPVVLLTARPDENTKIEALTAGATDFVGKPFSLTEVRVRLNNLVESHRHEKKLAEQTARLESALEQLKESEALLVRQEKLSSLGRMSAGLIHEINNPLNFAVQGLHFLRQQMPQVPEDSREVFIETLGDIEAGVNRVSTIITDLRSFTRSDNSKLVEFEIRPLIETVLRFFSHQIKGFVEVHIDIPEGMVLLGNHGQLTQVLVNLVQNSLDAMDEKSFHDDEKPTLHVSAREEDGRILLKVRDNGAGMTLETQEHVFDPFFTTKDVGKGMGLGLAISHRIIMDHQGSISLRSKPGEGTEFILDLPQACSYVHPHPEAAST